MRAVDGIDAPGKDRRKTRKSVVPGCVLSGRFGRAIRAHNAADAVGEVVVIKAVNDAVVSDVDILPASRRPSRPKALPVVVPLLRGRVKSVNGIVLAGKVVTVAESTVRPVTGGVGDGDAGTLPNAALPVTRILTGGRG